MVEMGAKQVALHNAKYNRHAAFLLGSGLGEVLWPCAAVGRLRGPVRRTEMRSQAAGQTPCSAWFRRGARQLEGANARPTPASWAPEADVRAALQLVSVRRM